MYYVFTLFTRYRAICHPGVATRARKCARAYPGALTLLADFGNGVAAVEQPGLVGLRGLVGLPGLERARSFDQ